MAPLPVRIETGRLTLRPPRLGDAAAVTALVGDWEIARRLALVPYPYERTMAAGWIADAARLRAVGTVFAYVLEVRAGEDAGRLVGAFDLRLDAGDAGAAIGYWVG